LRWRARRDRDSEARRNRAFALHRCRFNASHMQVDVFQASAASVSLKAVPGMIAGRGGAPGTSSMLAFRSQRSRQPRKTAGAIRRFACAGALAIACASTSAVAIAQPLLDGEQRPVRIVAFGDSLTAGYGLPADAAFPARLANALEAKGARVEIANAGVSGETSSDGLARLDWSVPEGTDAVILEFGANDALRGIDPKITREALETILVRLKQRGIAVLLAGMLAPPNLGIEFTRAFDAIFPDLASRFDVVLYPFFLDGVAARNDLNQSDGLHPNAAGVEVIVSRMLPEVEALIAKVKARRT
jgi:acyl-CoA thioesterase I